MAPSGETADGNVTMTEMIIALPMKGTHDIVAESMGAMKIGNVNMVEARQDTDVRKIHILTHMAKFAYTILCVYIMVYTLSVTAWNMRCMGNTAGPYLQKVMKNTEILALSEHGLFSCELHILRDFDSDYLCMAKADKHLNDEMFGTIRGHGGCAILWHRSIANHVIVMPELGTDRMCAIRIVFPGVSPMIVVAVYLPPQGCVISDFKDELKQLQIIKNDCTSNGEVMIIGDTNVHLGPEYGLRGWGTQAKTVNYS